MPFPGSIILPVAHFLDGIAAYPDCGRLTGMDPARKVFSQPFHHLSFIYRIADG
jgi:hypothetical protein